MFLKKPSLQSKGLSSRPNLFHKPTIDQIISNEHQELLDFATCDAKYQPDRGLLDLRTTEEDPPQRLNFKVQAKIGFFDPILAEIDSDSHLSIINEKYFRSTLLKGNVKFAPEEPPTFNGLGSKLKSEFPPVLLDLQIGGALLSGRFIVSKEMCSSQMLIGTDIG